MATRIRGVNGLTPAQIADQVQEGGKFVVYQWCISIVVMTFKRGTDVYYIRPGQSAVVPGLPWTLLTFIVGWWGFPWGFVYTPTALFTNLSGGKDVTYAVMAQLMPKPAAMPLATAYDLDVPLKNPW